MVDCKCKDHAGESSKIWQACRDMCQVECVVYGIFPWNLNDACDAFRDPER